MREFITEAVWLLLGGIGAYMSLVREFQMLQQNSYFAHLRALVIGRKRLKKQYFGE